MQEQRGKHGPGFLLNARPVWLSMPGDRLRCMVCCSCCNTCNCNTIPGMLPKSVMETSRVSLFSHSSNPLRRLQDSSSGSPRPSRCKNSVVAMRISAQVGKTLNLGQILFILHEECPRQKGARCDHTPASERSDQRQGIFGRFFIFLTLFDLSFFVFLGFSSLFTYQTPTFLDPNGQESAVCVSSWRKRRLRHSIFPGSSHRNFFSPPSNSQNAKPWF